MEVCLDIPIVPLTEEQIKTILDARSVLLKEDVNEGKRENVGVPTSVAFGEDGRFIMYGNTQEFTEYATAQEMIAAQPPLPDPVFAPGEYVPCTYAVGAPLDRLDQHAAEFQEMIEEMFKAGPELRLTKEGVEEKIEQYQEVTLPVVENE